MMTGLHFSVALVTGATGFIGRWLMLELTSNGVEVCALIRNPEDRLPKLRAWVDARGGDGSKLHATPFDLSHPDLGLNESGRAWLMRAEAVYHLAARFDFGMPLEVTRRDNVDASVRLVELLASSERLQRLVHLSGYRTEGREARELDVHDARALARFYRAHGPYEGSKVEAHYRVAEAAAAFDVPLTRISPAVVIGDSRSGETTQYLGLAETLQRLHAGKLPALPGNRHTWLPVIPVDTLGALLARVPDDAGSLGGHVVVLDEHTPNLRELVALAARQMGATAPRFSVPVGILRCLPMALSGVHPEALTFISDDRYDAAPVAELAARVGITLPDVETSLTRWIDYLVTTDFGQREPDGGATTQGAA
ncbi:NAD-dependent epimerase/dehydratase family protein [Lujinxingia vulgaris]|uniref:NAD-dependent epimerase/dehydratase family protein n=1 Tax=Lujinxingia vulgaris TaxID=2600176 RepID=A0A5C6XPW1_9DELT|nr:SDR family oxidoreductase [Lujinxingia vulgaris]TXD39758.1 NAD-dependent epimerase/dehydratase family protein [Lujinxingia vulgaris]